MQSPCTSPCNIKRHNLIFGWFFKKKRAPRIKICFGLIQKPHRSIPQQLDKGFSVTSNWLRIENRASECSSHTHFVCVLYMRSLPPTICIVHRFIDRGASSPVQMFGHRNVRMDWILHGLIFCHHSFDVSHLLRNVSLAIVPHRSSDANLF